MNHIAFIACGSANPAQHPGGCPIGNYAKWLALALCLLITAPAAAEPTLVVHWSIANAGQQLGSVGWVNEPGGWPQFIADHVKPAVAWCRASGVKPVILIHHPFGQYTQEPMHLDGYDYAKAAGATWLTNSFATLDGWKSVTVDVPCYAYVGGCDLTPRLRDLPPPELRTMILRNLQPLKDAGFRGIYIDYAENAITNEHYGVNAAQSNRRSVDTILVAIADKLFPEPCGVEAAPRAFPVFKPLWTRNIVALDAEWQHRYGPVGRNPNYAGLGYNRSVLTGKVWRTLHYSDDAAATVAAAKAIAADGCTPAVFSQPLIRAGVKASDLLGN